MHRNILIVIALILLGAGAVAALRSGQVQVSVPGVVSPTPIVTTAPSITNFEECVAAGNPVMESYPAQCMANGKTFTQIIIGSPTPSPQIVDKSNLIKVTSPTTNQVVKSPLQVTGEARGNWYFEASFPVSLYDSNNKRLAQVPAQAQGEWMTENFVPFKATLNFSTPTTDTGYLLLEKDNPSGLPENADELRVPVRFK